MHMRVYYAQQGGHIHCRMFTAPRKELTHGLCGRLVFTEAEWPAVRGALESIAEVLPEPNE